MPTVYCPTCGIAVKEKPDGKLICDICDCDLNVKLRVDGFIDYWLDKSCVEFHGAMITWDLGEDGELCPEDYYDEILEKLEEFLKNKEGVTFMVRCEWYPPIEYLRNPDDTNQSVSVEMLFEVPKKPNDPWESFRFRIVPCWQMQADRILNESCWLHSDYKWNE